MAQTLNTGYMMWRLILGIILMTTMVALVALSAKKLIAREHARQSSVVIHTEAKNFHFHFQV